MPLVDHKGQIFVKLCMTVAIVDFYIKMPYCISKLTLSHFKGQFFVSFTNNIMDCGFLQKFAPPASIAFDFHISHYLMKMQTHTNLDKLRQT